MNPPVRAWRWGLAAGLLAALLRLPALRLLLDRDEGEFATLAWLWRAGKGVPYQDWLEQKPPLTLLPHVVAQACFVGDPVLGLRWISLAWSVATVLALFGLVLALARAGRLGGRLRFAPRRVAVAAGLGALTAAVLFNNVRTQALAANTETWQTLPLLGALAVFFLPPPDTAGRARWLLGGCLLGLGSLFKQPLLAGVLFLPWGAYDPRRGLARPVLWTVLGAALPWGLAAACFGLHGAQWDFLNCTLAYNQGYVAQGQSGAWLRLLGLVGALGPSLAGVLGLAILGWRALERDRAPRRMMAAWLAVGLCTLAASGHYYPHYALLLLAPLALLAGFGLVDLWAPWPGRRIPVGARILRAALLALAVGSYVAQDAGLWLKTTPSDATLYVYHVRTFATAPDAAAEVQRLCPPEQHLFIWGNEAELYFLSKREPASRFLFIYPFTGEAPPWPDGDLQLLACMQTPSTGAAALTEGLDPEVPVQAQIQHELHEHFEGNLQVPGWVLGGRR
jgi:hypothetical protein